MNKTKLRKYARLIAEKGVNIQKGQEVIITAEPDQPEFVKILVEECYKRGAKKVSVDFTYQALDKIHTRYCSSKVLGTLEDWQIAKWERQAEVLPAKIYLTSEDPDGLKGINQEKYAKATAARAKTIKPIRRRMENKYQWCIAGVPGADWAKKVFPGVRVSRAIEMLWDAILSVSRADGENPLADWDIHNANFHEKCDKLNSMNIRKLIYHSENGTDLEVGLVPDILFCGGGEDSSQGIYFNANIPTEEVFTAPMRGEAEGIVYSSMPLSYDGQLIDKFFIRFKEGKAVEWGAEVGEDVLKSIIETDEGSAYLGECALVPYSSPIRKSGILFYNTLFDENAVCHFALGAGYTNLLRDYDKYTEEELHAKGINDSVTHVDFMIGTADLSVIGVTADGERVQLFRDGEWAI